MHLLYYVRKLRPLISGTTEYRLRRAGYSVLPAPRTAHSIAHCCVWKTGSQWIRLVMSDPEFYRATGLTPYPVFNSVAVEKGAEFGFREPAALLNFFADYGTFRRVAEGSDVRPFFVVRDPRDLIVSWYFSSRYTHPETDRINALRAEMKGMNDSEGIGYSIEYFERIAKIIQSWVDAKEADPSIWIVKYEDLTGPDMLETWSALLDHLDIQIDAKLLERLFGRYSKANLMGPSSAASSNHKYRGGRRGEWRKLFDDNHYEQFENRYGNLIGLLNYGV